jgi:hypothetical protein
MCMTSQSVFLKVLASWGEIRMILRILRLSLRRGENVENHFAENRTTVTLKYTCGRSLDKKSFLKTLLT